MIRLKSSKLFLLGSIDLVVTSPPYFRKREYPGVSLGSEVDYVDYLRSLASLFMKVHRILKPTGSVWLNLGDTYVNKSLKLIPSRLAIMLTDDIGFILRNDVIWNKMKGGPVNSKDKFRNIHEHFFFF